MSKKSRNNKNKGKTNNSPVVTDSNISFDDQVVLDDDKVKEKLIELEQSKNEYEKKLSEITLKEKGLEEQYQAEKKKALDTIKENERNIRAEEYEKLQSEWKKEETERKAALEEEIADLKSKAKKDQEEAHKLRVDASNYMNDRILSADSQIEERFNELNSEFENKLEELRKEKREFEISKQELEDSQAEIEDEKEIISDLKKKYLSCSPANLIKLKTQISELELINDANNELVKEQTKRLAKLQALTLNSNGESYISRIEQLEDELKRSYEKLSLYANFPSEERIVELEKYEKESESLKITIDELRAQLVNKEDQLRVFALDKRELENARVEARALESMNNQYREKLKSIAEQYKTVHESKFQGLLEIDKIRFPESDKRLFYGSLKDMVDFVRNYGANPDKGTPLYYSEETIRVFIASLATSEPSSRLIILQGLSGTGKSSLPELFHNALDIDWQSIAVQPSWRDNRELLGYDNDFTNRFKETEFTKALYKASLPINRDNVSFIVLDEMNLARIEYYFADFLSELEHRNATWKIPLVSSFDEKNNDLRPQALNYDNGTANLLVTKNIWFIGTANNDDSTSLITDKVYDRAQILDMDNREGVFKAPRMMSQHITATKLKQMFEEARNDSDYSMNGHDWEMINSLDSNYLQKMDITFGNRMKNQLEDFVPVYQACGGTKGGALDYFLAHKILRKLDEKYDAYIADCLGDLKLYLSSQKKYGAFKRSIEKIDTILRRNFEVEDR